MKENFPLYKMIPKSSKTVKIEESYEFTKMGTINCPKGRNTVEKMTSEKKRAIFFSFLLIERNTIFPFFCHQKRRRRENTVNQIGAQIFPSLNRGSTNFPRYAPTCHKHLFIIHQGLNQF
jgi:hypothetical protein